MPGVDIEDVLLLTDSTRPNAFAANFCKIAEFYGLLCKRLDLNQTEISDESLRDSRGVYFPLIGLDAHALLDEPSSLSEAEITCLQSAVETGEPSLFVSKIFAGGNAAALARLTGGAVTGMQNLSAAHHNWIVSAEFSEITRQFTGQVIVSPPTANQEISVLELDDQGSVTPVISAVNDSGQIYPVFAHLQMGAGAVLIDAGEAPGSLEEGSLRDSYYFAPNFSQIVPLMMAMRDALGGEAWHAVKNYANLTIDDPVLEEPFYKLSYFGLLAEMLAHNFHTTIALIPAQWEQNQPVVVSLFEKYPERFSIVQHGNNHDGYEFFRYQASPEDLLKGKEFTSRPLSDQEWDIQEGLGRMARFTEMTGLSYDRVMVFPYGISPEPTLKVLKEHNYLATTSSQDAPLGTERPSDWDFGLYPAEMAFENFPVLTRRQPGAYQPFRPDIQPFIFDLFLDKPALFYSHAYQGELFEDGVSAFNPVADQINALAGDVEWQSLGFILRHLYLQKTNDDGNIDVHMFSNRLSLTNQNNSELTFHIRKEEVENVPILNLTVNGYEIPYRLEEDLLRLDIRLPAGATAEISIVYGYP
jgi:hypothetical protein